MQHIKDAIKVLQVITVERAGTPDAPHLGTALDILESTLDLMETLDRVYESEIELALRADWNEICEVKLKK